MRTPNTVGISFEDLRGAAIETLNMLLTKSKASPQLIAGMQPNLEKVATIFESWAIKELEEDPTAKDIYKVLNQALVLMGATALARGENLVNTWIVTVAPLALSALLRGVGLSLGIPLVL